VNKWGEVERRRIDGGVQAVHPKRKLGKRTDEIERNAEKNRMTKRLGTRRVGGSDGIVEAEVLEKLKSEKTRSARKSLTRKTKVGRVVLNVVGEMK
jgi:DNA primase catalytic subunit